MNLCLFFKKLIHSEMLWATVFLFGLEFFVIKYYHNIFISKPEIFIVLSTGFVAVYGYFAAHYFEIRREQRELKLTQYLALMKSMRLLILESDYKNTAKRSDMRDEFQNAYLSFSLLVSSKSYDALQKMMKDLTDHLSPCADAEQIIQNLKQFKLSQSIFVNSLRKELFVDKQISFETFDIQI